MIRRLAELVRLESPSRDKPALDALGALLADRLRDVGGSVEIIPNAHGGDHLVGRFPGTSRPAAGPCAGPLRHGLAAWERSNGCRSVSTAAAAHTGPASST